MHLRLSAAALLLSAACQPSITGNVLGNDVAVELEGAFGVARTNVETVEVTAFAAEVGACPLGVAAYSARLGGEVPATDDVLPAGSRTINVTWGLPVATFDGELTLGAQPDGHDFTLTVCDSSAPFGDDSATFEGTCATASDGAVSVSLSETHLSVVSVDALDFESIGDTPEPQGSAHIAATFNLCEPMSTQLGDVVNPDG